MKKKVLGLTAILMSLAMSTSAFAAVQRGDSAQLDGREGLSGQDLAIILDYAKNAYNGENADKANFDGNWVATDNKVTMSDYNAAIKYMLQPESFEETVAIRAYSSTNTVVGNKVANPYKGGEIDSQKNYDGTYADSTANLTAATNDTVKSVAEALIAQTTDKTAETLAENISNVYFTSANKGDIYLTSDEGWAVLEYSLRAIVPVDEASCLLINKDYASLDASEKAEAMTAEKQAQYDALKAIKAKIVTGSTLTLTKSDVIELHNLVQAAIPATTSQDAIKKTADEIAGVVNGKYTITINGMEVSNGESAGVQALLPLSNYETTTINDVKNVFGDTIEVAVTGPSGNVFKFNVDLYVAGGAKAIG